MVATEPQQNEKKKKLITFLLEIGIKARIDQYCDTNSMSMAQFFRLAAIEKLDSQIEQTSKVAEIDLSHATLALGQVIEQNKKIEQMIEFLIDQKQKTTFTEHSVIENAKALLLKNEPLTYEEAARFVPEIDTMNEAINQLLKEGKVQYKRKRFSWL
ncbi:MAG: hypothetical protein ACFFC7_20165 [Candidatus Hermodarchaeota archaeon]